MLQKVTRLDSVPTAEETVLTTEVPTKESRLYTLLAKLVMPNDGFYSIKPLTTMRDPFGFISIDIY